MFKQDILNREGFTLLEVMIAMAILAIALVAVFQSQSQSVSMAGRTRFLTTASLLAQGKMAELEAADPGEISSSSGSFGEDFPDYLWRVRLTDTAFRYLKKIDVIVTNNRLTANNAYQLELYRFIRK
jgi:general secretion pathway protein I